MEPDSLYTSILFFLLSLLICALYSFLETSITALRLFKLKELSRRMGGKYKAFFYALEHKPQYVLSTILIANSLANATSTALITKIMENLFVKLKLPEGLGFSIGVGFAAIAILIFGEIIPKNLAKKYGERLLISTLWIASITYKLLYPFSRLLSSFSNIFLSKIRGKKESDDVSEWVSSEKEIQFLIDYIGERGLMETEKTEMLKNIFELGKTPVFEVMIPATDMISVDLTNNMKDVLNIFNKYHFTRLPVYDEKKETIVGIVHLKDLLLLLIKDQEKPLREIVRPTLFIPESLKINQLLRELRQQNCHLAIAIDEHGSIVGLITLEDALEEIVGEISDEHERVTEKIIKLKQGGWLIDASIPLEDLSELLGISFESESSITLGGFITERLQRLPQRGEGIVYNGYDFQVKQASPKRVLRVIVQKDSKE